MEGTYPIKLLEPLVDGFREHEAYAERIDRRGYEFFDSSADIAQGSWTSIFKVRNLGLDLINNSWDLRDEHGRLYDVEFVSQDKRTKGRFIYIYALYKS